MIEAAERLVEQDTIHFVIAGEGLLLAEARLRGNRLRNLTFLPLQAEEAMYELLNLADIHVLPQEPAAADLMLPSKLGTMLASRKQLIVLADPVTELHDLLRSVATLVPAGSGVGLATAIAASANSDRLYDPRPGLVLAQMLPGKTIWRASKES